MRALALAFLLLCAAVSAQPIAPAPEYESAFHRRSGWTGADGTYSLALPDGQTLWVFSDTFFGEVKDNARQAPARFVHNSVAVQRGADFHFLQAPVFEPPNDEHWFWMHDGADGDQILLGEFLGTGVDNGFGFQQVGLWVARYRVSGDRVRVLDLRRLPFFVQEGGKTITFGPAILQTPSWLYCYGVLDTDGQRYSVLARVPRGCLNQSGAWRFYDGTGWSRSVESVTPLFPNAAMEASVHRTSDGSYLYVGSEANGMGPRIISRWAPAPEGPWGDPQLIMETPEHRGDVYTYNAKAHPELSRGGRLLISYNVNTTNFEKLMKEADIYRPRFVWWTPPNSGWLPAPFPAGRVEQGR